MSGFEPGQSCGPGPKYKWVGCIQDAGEGPQGVHRLQANQNFVAVAGGRTTVNDFNVQTRQACGCRAVSVVMGHDECPRYANMPSASQRPIIIPSVLRKKNSNEVPQCGASVAAFAPGGSR